MPIVGIKRSKIIILNSLRGWGLLLLFIQLFAGPLLGQENNIEEEEEKIEKEHNWFYVSPGLSIGNFDGRFINVNLTGDSKIRFQLGTSRQRQKPIEEPSEVIRDPFSSPDEKFDYITSFYILAGYSFSLNEKHTSRFEILAGPTFSEYRYHTNFILDFWDSKRGPHYSSEILSNQMTGLILRPQFVFYHPKANFIGFNIGPAIYLFQDIQAYSLEFGISIGYLGPKQNSEAF